jgi:hypothetical protein
MNLNTVADILPILNLAIKVQTPIITKSLDHFTARIPILEQTLVPQGSTFVEFFAQPMLHVIHIIPFKFHLPINIPLFCKASLFAFLEIPRITHFSIPIKHGTVFAMVGFIIKAPFINSFPNFIVQGAIPLLDTFLHIPMVANFPVLMEGLHRAIWEIVQKISFVHQISVFVEFFAVARLLAGHQSAFKPKRAVFIKDFTAAAMRVAVYKFSGIINAPIVMEQYAIARLDAPQKTTRVLFDLLSQIFIVQSALPAIQILLKIPRIEQSAIGIVFFASTRPQTFQQTPFKPKIPIRPVSFSNATGSFPILERAFIYQSPISGEFFTRPVFLTVKKTTLVLNLASSVVKLGVFGIIVKIVRKLTFVFGFADVPELLALAVAFVG